MDYDHNIWQFAVLLNKSYFMIVLSVVDLIIIYEFWDEKLDKKGAWLSVGISFNNCLGGEIRKLSLEWWRYMVIVQRSVSSWHFCVMQKSGRKSNSVLRLSYFFFIFVNWKWVWRFTIFRYFRLEFWVLGYRVLLIFTATNFCIEEGHKDVEVYFVDVCQVQRHVNQWLILLSYKQKIHEQENWLWV